MDVKQSYFDFLAEQGAREKVKALIAKEIEEWKAQPAYEYEAGEFQENDYSGRVNRIPNKTIGDIAQTEMQVLMSYTGDSEATYCSHYGFNFLIVADRMSWHINDVLSELRGKFFLKYQKDMFALLGIVPEEDWTDDDIYEAISENYDEYLNYEWFRQEFPEYIYKEDEESPRYNELIFDIND